MTKFTFICDTCNVEREASVISLKNRLEGTIICTCATCGETTETRFVTESNFEKFKEDANLV